MAFEITTVEVWEGEIEDRPGGLADALAEVLRTGANLDFMINRPCPQTPGRARLFLAPLQEGDQTRAASETGLARCEAHWLRIEGPDRPWLAAGIARTLADAGVNIGTLSAAVTNNRAVIYLSVDSENAARRAAQVLTPLLA